MSATFGPSFDTQLSKPATKKNKLTVCGRCKKVEHYYSSYCPYFERKPFNDCVEAESVKIDLEGDF